MELLDRYLQAVRFFLPRRGDQDDIIRELSENLRSQMEDREEELGRPLTNDERADILRRHGHPMLVAGRYRSHQHLIGSAFFPIYIFALKLGLGVALIVTPNRNHRLADGERPWNRYHVREFSPTELDVVMREAFDEIWLYGIHGSKAMNEIERGRVARARKLARLDPLGLRYHLPESIDTKLRRALRRRPSAAVSGEPRELAVEDMRHTRDDTADSLDLLAVGRV